MSFMSAGGGVIQGTGTALEMMANAREQAAMNTVRSNALSDQAGLNTQAQNLVQGSIAASTPQNAARQVAAGVANRTGVLTTLQGATPLNTITPSSGNGAARGTAGATAWGNMVGSNMAKSGAYSDWEDQQNIKNAQAGQKLGLLGSFAQGNANVLPIQMAAAGDSQHQLAGWGMLVSDIGASISGGAQSAKVPKGTDSGGGPVSDAYQQGGENAIYNIGEGGNVGGDPGEYSDWNSNVGTSASPY